MPTIKTKDGTEIYYKDWGTGQPIVFSPGWPLSADDWDAQMLFFGSRGFRVIAYDRRGHGRSSQVGGGHDMDHYADDLAALTAHLDLKNAVHVGHSTGGGEVVHYIARHGESRVAKAAIISAVPPLMVKTPANPGGLPKDVFDGLQAQLATNRAQFYYDVPAGPFYGYNRPGANLLLVLRVAVVALRVSIRQEVERARGFSRRSALDELEAEYRQSPRCSFVRSGYESPDRARRQATANSAREAMSVLRPCKRHQRKNSSTSISTLWARVPAFARRAMVSSAAARHSS
jgi:pimeloyl-ACP methyl ester carboxylesterase